MVAQTVNIDAKMVANLIHRDAGEYCRHRCTLNHVAGMHDKRVLGLGSLVLDRGRYVGEPALAIGIRQEVRVEIV